MRKPILVLLLCFCTACTWAQPNNDSLIAALAKEQPDTTRVLLLSELAIGLFDKPDSMTLMADQALSIAKK